MSGSRVFSRRRFLALGTAASTGTVVVIACQQAPAAPAPQPTAPPQVVTQVVTQVVEKQVTQVVTQVVEKQVVVTPTPQPAVKGALDAWTFPLTDDDQAYIWKPLMLKFSQRYAEIGPKIEVLPWSGRREKMLAAYAAGSPPDVAYVNSDTLSLFGSNGVLQDAGSLVAQDVWADIPEEVTKLGITWKGKKILTPAFVFGSSHLANVTLLGQLGYSADTTALTWQEVLDLGAKGKAQNLYATSWSTTDWGDFVQTVWQAGGTVYSDDVTKVLLDQPPAEEALTFWADCFQKGFVPKEGAVGSEQEASVARVNYFYTNKQVLSAEGDSGYVTQTVKQAPSLKFSVLQPFKNKQQFNLANSGGWGIFNKSKNTPATAIWVNFMMEPENDGFYCSLAGQAPSRKAAQTFWVADSNARKFLAVTQPSLRTNQDSNYFWQEGKTTTAPHFQAAVLGKTPVKQALADATKELQKIVDDFWAKAKA